MASYSPILESLAAAQRPARICAKHGISMVDLIEFASEPENAAFLEKAHAFHARQRAMRQERHAALALDALMVIGLDETPPADNLEARHRAIRVRALACVMSGGSRRTGGVVRPKGEPRGAQRATDRARHVLHAEAASSTPPGAASGTGETPVPPGEMPRDPENLCLPLVTPEVRAEAYALLESLVEEDEREEHERDDEVIRYAEAHNPIWKDAALEVIADKRRQQAINAEARRRRNDELEAPCAAAAGHARASPATSAATNAAHPHPP